MRAVDRPGNKKVLITGATGGIGTETAKLFAAKGYDLFLHCHKNEKKLQVMKEELSKTARCEIITCDLGNYEQVRQMFLHLPVLDILINNAGIAYYGLLSEMDANQWQKVMDVNVNGMFYTCKEVLPGMIGQKSGRIINISSVWGLVGASVEVAYSTSKGAVNAFTKALAKELAPSNIQVNAIAFGVIDTDMNSHLEEEEKEELYQSIPMGRFASPKEAADMIWQTICLPDYVTGQVIVMDGGFI